MNKYFSRAAQAGLVVANTLVAVPAGASLPPDMDFRELQQSRLYAGEPKPDLYACIVKATLATAQNINGKKSDVYFEHRFKDDDGLDTRMVSTVRKLNENWNSGPIVYLKPGLKGAGSLTIEYSYSAVGDIELTDPNDTVTTVQMDREDMSGYITKDTVSGPKADPETVKVIHDNALYTAGRIINCMKPKTGQSVDLN